MIIDKIDKKILEAIRGELVSGEKLSATLGISRTAVWKRIKKLEDLGYKIKHERKGYRLEKTTNYLLCTEIESILKTRWLGKNYIFFKQINSTNIFAKKEELEDGTVVLAETQTGGKGRKGRKWLSVEGKGLYFSIVLNRNIPINELMTFSFIFPVGVKKAIEKETGLKINIKWPNDLYLNNKKLAGFLIETEFEGNYLYKLVAGIGININHDLKDLQELKETATSLKIETGKEYDRKSLFGKILSEIENLVEEFDRKKVIEEVDKSLLWKGERVKLVDEGIEGVLVGLNSSGGIRVFTDNKIKDFYSGEITLRRAE
ncbi:BirA family transcriptional regulator, biotin operon repressor / biotin-[acetyl-CoA-carboxylase] ligase [Persephonella hydrogeniphila]|uniref:Bifunctional ligase/repressor BirA n=1 Tax=Persephonella hydrogeniphila TaxID=198703 RepID=A0A285NKZ7_9AQUI|nr:biotin--[acetyl-CoA-carboxylase] ligase [Persephonella hydrogeniphila]SNZ08546.1 BirA family transcriptional regulator, biotin operon repressor / biotin-[acetyl-CoA-carboxylase] ligase [Persephonella hydrogeniphila]